MVVRCVPSGFDREGIVCLQVSRVFGLYPNTKDLRPRSFRQALELTARSWMPTRHAHSSHPGLESGPFSGFNRAFDYLKRFSDIQCQTGKPIMIPTANAAKT
jgi:hypothetical protein